MAKKRRNLKYAPKYKKKYAEELMDGLRNDHKMSIQRVCQKWGITRRTYYNWIEQYPEFKHAHEIGERDYSAVMQDMIIDIAMGERRGNAGVVQLVAQHTIGWGATKDSENKEEDKIQTININVVGNDKKQQKKLENGNIIDAEYSEIDDDAE